MKIVIAVTAVALSALAQAQTRKSAESMTDAQFAKTFQCPESLPNEAARSAAIRRFVNWGAARHPEWDVQRLVAYRVSLLEANGCEQSLRNIREASK